MSRRPFEQRGLHGTVPSQWPFVTGFSKKGIFDQLDLFNNTCRDLHSEYPA